MMPQHEKTLEEAEALFWLGMKKPAEIWRKMQRDLIKHGFTWPKYLQLLKAMRKEVVLHEIGSMSLTIFVALVEAEARGPLGDYILHGGGPRDKQ